MLIFDKIRAFISGRALSEQRPAALKVRFARSKIANSPENPLSREGSRPLDPRRNFLGFELTSPYGSGKVPEAAVRPSAGVFGAGQQPATQIGQRNAEIQERNQGLGMARQALKAAQQALEKLERAVEASRRWVLGLARGLSGQAAAERDRQAREVERQQQERAREAEQQERERRQAEVQRAKDKGRKGQEQGFER